MWVKDWPGADVKEEVEDWRAGCAGRSWSRARLVPEFMAIADNGQLWTRHVENINIDE